VAGNGGTLDAAHPPSLSHTFEASRAVLGLAAAARGGGLSGQIERARRPLTWGADQGLRLGGSRGRGAPATMQQAPSRALENPAIASYRFRALKVSPE
jgi:hypothetical protein